MLEAEQQFRKIRGSRHGCRSLTARSVASCSGFAR